MNDTAGTIARQMLQLTSLYRHVAMSLYDLNKANALPVEADADTQMRATTVRRRRLDCATRLMEIAVSASELGCLVCEIGLHAPRAVLPEPPGPPQAPAQFHCFTRLPTELKLMIWKIAATPSYSPQYYTTLWQQNRPLPTSGFLPDRGIWKADKLSRRSMAEEYKKVKAIVRAPGYAEPDDKLGQHDRRLAEFIKMAFQLKVDLITKAGQFTREFSEMDIPDTCCAMRHLYQIDIDKDNRWKFSTDRVPTESLFEKGWELRPKTSVATLMLEMISAGNIDATREDARKVARVEPETCDGIFHRSDTVVLTNP